MALDKNLQLFNFSPEVIEHMKNTQEIPVNFYNKDGAVLIPRKEHVNPQIIERLFGQMNQGIYYDALESDKLGIRKNDGGIPNGPEGLTNTKLLGEQAVRDLALETSELFNQLKMTSFSAVHSARTAKRVNEFIEQFEKQPEAMVGLVNVLEHMGGDTSGPDAQLAVKRSVVAMALKSRSMKAQISRDRGRGPDAITAVMMSSMLAQIGKLKMNLPGDRKLTEEERLYVRKFPVMSYLMVAHEPTVDFFVKRNILNQRRTLPDSEGLNNYPNLKWMVPMLLKLAEDNRAKGKMTVADDIMKQVQGLREFTVYEEDVNIISLASEFASLTSETQWRSAYDPITAVKIIINDSFFNYSAKSLRDFLDHVSISLCNNQKIINNGDFLILHIPAQGGKHFFEVVKVVQSGRFQSKPNVIRIGTINMKPVNNAGVFHVEFDIESVRPDKRHILITMNQDYLRRIIYIIDPVIDPMLYQKIREISAYAPS